MASYVFPAVMAEGILSQSNKTAGATAQKIWADSTKPADMCKGFIVLVKTGPIYLGSSTVTTAGATQGLTLAANDTAAGSIDGPGATEVYETDGAGAATYLTLEIG